MSDKKLHPRQLFMIITYGSYAIITLILIIIASVIENLTLTVIAATFVLLLLPIIILAILAGIPETIAGNLFMLAKIQDKEKKKLRMSAFCSKRYLDSDEFSEFLNHPPIKFSYVRKDKNNKDHFIVSLANKQKFSVRVVKKNEVKDSHYCTKYVVDFIAEIIGDYKSYIAPAITDDNNKVPEEIPQDDIDNSENKKVNTPLENTSEDNANNDNKENTSEDNANKDDKNDTDSSENSDSENDADSNDGVTVDEDNNDSKD